MFNIDNILDITSTDFERLALDIFRFQAQNCVPYRDYITAIGVDINNVHNINEIPFLPIELFKTHKIYCGEKDAEIVFTSSNTGGSNPSKHYMAKTEIYEKTFAKAFELFYKNARDISIYGLLPNYLERDGSSLIYMVDRLIAKNKEGKGGFYLDNYDALLRDMKKDTSPKILLGVSYALWDLAEHYPTEFSNTIIMETGGMKGRREEISKGSFHKILCDAFHVNSIHSEYGMAELTSQAYSSGEGIFHLPSWMRVVLRDLNNPFDLGSVKRGGINIIDLANVYSCSFLQTQDVGVMRGEGFMVLGRNEHSEIRGCNLLVSSF